MCDEAGLDICINEHGDEVRVGSVDVLDKDQVDASKHMVGNVDDGHVDEKTEEEGLNVISQCLWTGCRQIKVL